MQDTRDKQTLDILGTKRRGRPSTGKALSGAERVRKHREKKAKYIAFVEKHYITPACTKAELQSRLDDLLGKFRQPLSHYEFENYLLRVRLLRSELGLISAR